MQKKQIDKRALRKIIRKLLEHGPLSESELVSELAKRYELDKTSVDRSVDKLVKSRRIERVPHVGLRLRPKKFIKKHRKKTREAKLVSWHYEKGDERKLEALGSEWFKKDGLRRLAEQPAWKASKLGTKLKGIYALYRTKGNVRTIYYVGKAQQLPSRVQQHLKDELSGKWDEFSMYGTKDKRIAAALETVLIKVARPEANRQKKKVSLGVDLRRTIAAYFKEKAKNV
jgi:DNA-binding MarR family transcriptional regulator